MKTAIATSEQGKSGLGLEAQQARDDQPAASRFRTAQLGHRQMNAMAAAAIRTASSIQYWI
jgi:hypothetical protein